MARSMCFHDSRDRRELNAFHHRLEGRCLPHGSISGFQLGVLHISEKTAVVTVQ